MLNRLFLTILAFALTMFGSNIVSTADTINNPEDHRSFPFLVSSLNFGQWETFGPDKRVKIVESKGAPSGQAYRVTVKKKKPNHWDIATRNDMVKDIKKDDVIVVSFWARAAKPQKGKEKGDIYVALQRDIEPYDQVILERIALDTEWKKYHLSGKANRDYAANVTELNYNLALAKQTIEFAEYYVMNIGPDGDPEQYIP